MKKDLKFVREISRETVVKLWDNKIGVEQGKAIAYNCSNIVKACIAEIKLKKNE